MALRKYPRTYHLPWSQGSTDDDKTHSLAAIERMFGGREVVITEKMDGENTTIYSTGECHARSLDSGKHPSRDYVRAKAREVAYMGLPEGWRIMGENLYARHSIEYDLLPDYFVIFGVADENDYSRPWDEVEEWAELLDLPHAPVVWRGIWNTEEVMGLYPFKSMLSSTAPSEGYVVRLAGAFPMSQFDKNVAKFVRSGHVQPDAVHWMHQSVTPNKRRKNPLTARVENMAGRPLRRARLAAQAGMIAPAVEPAPNSRTVNRALAEAGIPVTLYKGKGYFYIEAEDGTQVDSIYVPYWDDYSVSEWVEHVRYEYEQAHPQPLYVGGPARRPNPTDLATATHEVLRAAHTAMDHLSMLKRALYSQQPAWATASLVADDSLYTVVLVRAAHDVEMAVHAARDAGTLVRPVVKDLAFDVQVAAQRAARTAQALRTQVINHRGSEALTSDLASAVNLADRDIHNAYLACVSLLSAVIRPR